MYVCMHAYMYMNCMMYVYDCVHVCMESVCTSAGRQRGGPVAVGGLGGRVEVGCGHVSRHC